MCIRDSITMLRDTLRRFIDKEMPRDRVSRWDKENVFPREVHLKLAELGLTGLTVPEAYGGSGRDITATIVTIEELCSRSMAVGCAYIQSSCYAGLNLVEVASEAQRRELLPRVASEGLMFAYGFTEPDVGADLASVRTTARRDGDELVIRGLSLIHISRLDRAEQRAHARSQRSGHVGRADRRGQRQCLADQRGVQPVGEGHGGGREAERGDRRIAGPSERHRPARRDRHGDAVLIVRAHRPRAARGVHQPRTGPGIGLCDRFPIEPAARDIGAERHDAAFLQG